MTDTERVRRLVRLLDAELPDLDAISSIGVVACALGLMIGRLYWPVRPGAEFLVSIGRIIGMSVREHGAELDASTATRIGRA